MATLLCPLRAKADIATYSITSSASNCIELGFVSPSVLAVPQIDDQLDLVRRPTGTSPGSPRCRIGATDAGTAIRVCSACSIAQKAASRDILAFRVA